jgi:hypothetical protein
MLGSDLPKEELKSIFVIVTFRHKNLYYNTSMSISSIRL